MSVQESDKDKLKRLVNEREKLLKQPRTWAGGAAKAVGIDGVINSVVTTVDGLLHGSDKEKP